MFSDLAADVRAIELLRRQVEAAENAGDADSIAAVFDTDAVAMVPDFPVQEGGAACAAFIRDLLPGLLAHFDRRITYVSGEIQVLNDLAFDRGTFSYTVVPRSGGTVERVTGKYFWMYRREPASRWKLFRMIVTRDDPARNDAEPREAADRTGFARLASALSLPFAAFLAIGETVRNWGDWGWWPIWTVAYSAAILLMAGWVVERHENRRGPLITAGGWGFTAAMILMTLLTRLNPAPGSEHGPLPPGLLTGATAGLLLVALLAFASSLTVGRSSRTTERVERGDVEGRSSGRFHR